MNEIPGNFSNPLMIVSLIEHPFALQQSVRKLLTVQLLLSGIGLIFQSRMSLLLASLNIGPCNMTTLKMARIRAAIPHPHPHDV